ncbi:hypothetical protein WME98_10830 [Sorangium sp. So ce296]|uniref:hypothetical protein n=1 Tax=Sorangium sp. So ce296 TaxID=3133296 RepID=UPI003F5DA680
MRNPGDVIGTYGKSRSLLFTGWFLAALFAGAGALVLSLVPGPGSTVRFDGDVSVLYRAGYGAIALGVVIALGTWWVVASQPVFVLHQNAIQARERKGTRTDFYADIEDLYTFYFGGIGYRATPQAPWVFIGARTSRYAELSRTLRMRHVEQRGERLYHELQAGGSVRFRALPDSVALSKTLFASRNMDHPMKMIELTRGHLTIEGKTIAIERIADVASNLWVERSQILDVDGGVFHTMHSNAVMSFDVLVALIARLQQDAASAARV